MDRYHEAQAAAADALADPGRVAARWRERHHGPVIAHLPYDVPPEIIWASGALPVGVFPPDPGTEQAHLPGWYCPPARRFLAAAVSGELDWADGLVIPQICDTMRGLKGLWQFLRNPAFLESFNLPRHSRPSARPYLTAELARLRDRIGEFTGRQADDAALSGAINLYNAVRANLALVFRKTAANLPRYNLVRAGFVLPPEEMLSLVEGLVPPENEAGPGVPVVVSGQLMEPLATAGLLDRCGLTVVGDDLVDGERALVMVPDADDPLAGLAERLFAAPPCAVKHGARAREAYLAGLVRERGAGGVIFLHFRNCEMENLGYPGLAGHLEGLGIPTLYLEAQWGTLAAGSVATRLEAFREMLEVC